MTEKLTGIPLPRDFDVWPEEDRLAWLSVLDGVPLKPRNKFAPKGRVYIPDIVAILQLLDLRVTDDILEDAPKNIKRLFVKYPDFASSESVFRKLMLNERTARILIGRSDTGFPPVHVGFFGHDADPAEDYVKAVARWTETKGQDASEENLKSAALADLLAFSPCEGSEKALAAQKAILELSEGLELDFIRQKQRQIRESLYGDDDEPATEPAKPAKPAEPTTDPEGTSE